MIKKIRYPTVAGQFYPENKTELSKLISQFIDQAPLGQTAGQLKAIIVPHAGYTFSGPVAGVAYRLVKDQWQDKNHIFLLGSSHRYPLSRPNVASFESWQTPLGIVEVDNRLKDLTVNDEVYLFEHSLEVQLPFLQTVLSNFTITPVLLNEYDSSLVNQLISQLKPKDAIVVSSDLSHYYSYDRAVELDNQAHRAIQSLDFQALKKVEACGLPAILTLIRLAEQKNWQAQLLAYQNSGDITGDQTKVVGYGAYGFFK